MTERRRKKKKVGVRICWINQQIKYVVDPKICWNNIVLPTIF